jgi:hypothetical protein
LVEKVIGASGKRLKVTVHDNVGSGGQIAGNLMATNHIASQQLSGFKALKVQWIGSVSALFSSLSFHVNLGDVYGFGNK